MLELSATRADGAHPYLTTPDHTRQAREIIGPDALLAPEQMVIFETDPAAARAIGRAAVGFYLRAPGYLASLGRLGSATRTGPIPRRHPTGSSTAWSPGVTSTRSPGESANITTPAPTTSASRCSAANRDLPVAQWRELADALL